MKNLTLANLLKGLLTGVIIGLILGGTYIVVSFPGKCKICKQPVSKSDAHWTTHSCGLGFYSCDKSQFVKIKGQYFHKACTPTGWDYSRSNAQQGKGQEQNLSPTGTIPRPQVEETLTDR